MGHLVDIFDVSRYSHPARGHVLFGYRRLLFEQRNLHLGRMASRRCLVHSKYP